ncbi:hypothetical protein DSO57_1037881 [Entomophthora muscae]|uniref:Uncharacterized protein n=1 Tax=Entomophthora muscae TaxID=34485 RepID=A0ACC2SBW9_9FUNG|nr:hypothetical protein DSO57_1037881 [Entomophthora muscae]
MDFEQAQFRSFEATFNGEAGPHQTSQEQKELFEKYLNNGKGKCRFAMTQFAALAFVRPEHTGLGFEALLEDAYIKKHSTIFKGHLDYFERQWVGKK